MSNFCLKYFWEGQKLTQKQQSIIQNENATWFQKNRKLIAMGIPILFFHSVWWTYMIKWDYFGLFTEEAGEDAIPRYYMSLTMVAGSMIAGATSEGGASVAFPVMTLAFNIKPAVARDFSFMIQTFGMSAAAFTIFFMKVQMEKRALVFSSLGGIVGIIFGLEHVAPHLEPAFSKMYFVTIWFAFAISLFYLNRFHGRKVFDTIQNFTWVDGVVLSLFGLTGGIFSSVAGSGIDICTFAILTLVYRVSEKTATPTSVVLMAINTSVGFMWREFYQDGVQQDAWGFLAVCIPIVVIGAPLGSLIGSHFHRLVLAACVYITDTVQLFGALWVVRPWSTEKTDKPLVLSLSCAAIFIGFACLFTLMMYRGKKVIEEWEAAHPDGQSSAEEKEDPKEARYEMNKVVIDGAINASQDQADDSIVRFHPAAVA